MRGQELQQLIDWAKVAVSQSVASTVDARCTAYAVFDRISAREGEARNVTPSTLPVCDLLTTALSAATGPRANVAAVFSVILPRLAWRRRVSADPSNVQFYNGHANTMLFGPGGIEDRDDVWVGATLPALAAQAG